MQTNNKVKVLVELPKQRYDDLMSGNIKFGSISSRMIMQAVKEGKLIQESTIQSSTYIQGNEEDGSDEDYITYMDACYEKNFYQIEDEVWAELGLYLDFSSVRFDDGTVFVYSDPNHENNADIWMGDDDEEITRIDYSDYAYSVETEVLEYPESQWKERYKKYLEGQII